MLTFYSLTNELFSFTFSKCYFFILHVLLKIHCTASEGRGPHGSKTVSNGYKYHSNAPRKSWPSLLKEDRTRTNGWQATDWRSAWTRYITCTTNNLVSLRFDIDGCCFLLKSATHLAILYADRSEFYRQRKSRANFAIDWCGHTGPIEAIWYFNFIPRLRPGQSIFRVRVRHFEKSCDKIAQPYWLTLVAIRGDERKKSAGTGTLGECRRIKSPISDTPDIGFRPALAGFRPLRAKWALTTCRSLQCSLP